MVEVRGMDDTDIVKIYKYYRDEKYALESLENHYFVFSCPYDFNDPIDCRIFIDVTKVANELDTELKGWIENAFIDDEEYAQELKRILIHSREDNERAYRKAVVDKMIEQMRVACFSEVYDNMLMWAHYASSHRGFCLGFVYRIGDPSLFAYLQKVHYANEYPELVQPSCVDMPLGEILNGRTEEEEMLQKLVLTKSEEWSYEREQRIVLTDDVGTPIPDKRKNKVIFHESFLSDIYLGCNMSKDTQDRIISIYKNHYCDASVYKMETIQKGFGIVPYKF
jgi:hypothetical protein